MKKRRTTNRTVAAVAMLAALGSLAGCGSKGPGDAEAGGVDREPTTASAPAPPQVDLQQEPRLDVEIGGVYVVNHEDYDGDLFRVGGAWYDYQNGAWYRADAYNGPYVAIEVGAVPREIFEVPAEHWKHAPPGIPPGQAKKMGL